MEENQFNTQNPFGFIRSQNEFIGISDKNKLRHMYISGLDSRKKEEFLDNMIANDINSGKSVVVLDPTGYLTDSVMDKIAVKRNDIHVLDASNIDFPFGLNLLELTRDNAIRRDMDKVIITDFCVNLLQRILGVTRETDKITEFLYASCKSVLDAIEEPSLLDLFLFITSLNYRNKVIEKLKDDSFSVYWKKELGESLKKHPLFDSSLEWQISKLKRMMGNKIVSPILFQKSSINISEVINNGGVILCRLSRNDIGFENVSIIGSIFFFKVQMAGMQRIMIPSEQRNPVFFYINDFHYFTQNSDSVKTFAEFLSEGRLYKMGLILNHPFVDQVAQEHSNFLFQAILNNCSTSITFKSSSYDAKIWEHYLYDDEYYSLYTQQNILNLKDNQFIGRTLLGDGVPSKPFLAETISFEYEPNQEVNDFILDNSKLSHHRDEILESIHNRMKQFE